MIEKLKGYTTDITMIRKIDELVDAVNSIVSVQEKLIDSRFVVETKHEAPAKNTLEEKGYIKLDSDSLQKFLKAHPEYNNNGVIEIPKKEPTENVQDKFAEQRKWIGKICKFWNWDTGLAHYSKFITIKDPNDNEMSNCPFRADDGGWYKHCEPVKPDDDIIYKGGANE